MVISANRISTGWLESESWNARAVPWKLPCTVVGTPMRFMASWICCVAADSEAPGARLNESVLAANWPWWLTASGVLVGP